MKTRLVLTMVAASIATLAVSDFALAQARRPAPSGAQPAASKPSDEDMIRQQAADFAAAFAKGDAGAIAATWTENAEYYEEGSVELHGRAAIQQAYQAFFAAYPGARIDINIQSIRFPSRDLAIEEGVSTLTYAGPELPSITRYLAIHVREDDRWITAVGREWGTGESKLEELAWLVGKWSATTPQGETHINFEWNAGQTALIGTFESVVAGQKASSGHQRIIRDPQSGQLHSWMFDDAGGHGEGAWTHDGNKWLIDTSGVAPDGTATAATNVLTRISDKEIMWRSIHRAAGDVELAPTDPIKLTRVEPTN